MVSDLLKRKDLYDYFSRSAFEKAHVYQAQGRVKGLEVSEDLTHLRARVRGSGSNEYRVDIQLEFSGENLTDLDGECSCPMSFNCKHVAATLLEATSGKPLSAGSMAREQGAATLPPVLGYEVANWLENVGNAVRGDDYPAELDQRLLYRLHPSDEGVQTPLLAVSLLSVKVLKGGGFGGNYTQPSVSDFVPERAPKYYRDSDLDILSQVSAASRAAHYGNRPLSGELLQRMVATGRAYWLDHNRQPLRWGNKREGRIEWRQASKRGVAPCLLVPGTIALNAEPPVYVDESAATIGPVELNLPPRLARQMLAAPEIPRAQVMEVSRRLGQRLPERHHGLLPAPPAAAVQIDEQPVPVLRLQKGRMSEVSFYYREARAVSGSVAVAHLGFRYGPIEIDLSERASRVEAFHAGQVYAIKRHQPKEKEARKRLTDLGFVEARAKFEPERDFPWRLNCLPRAKSSSGSSWRAASAISTTRSACLCRRKFARRSSSAAWPRATSLCSEPC